MSHNDIELCSLKQPSPPGWSITLVAGMIYIVSAFSDVCFRKLMTAMKMLLTAVAKVLLVESRAKEIELMAEANAAHRKAQAEILLATAEQIRMTTVLLQGYQKQLIENEGRSIREAELNDVKILIAMIQQLQLSSHTPGLPEAPKTTSKYRKKQIGEKGAGNSGVNDSGSAL